MIIELIISVVASWCLAKLLKLIQDIKQKKRFEWRFLLHDGGMPSAHTATVVSLAAAVFLEAGLSAMFMTTTVLALIVMNDATKVRWVTGLQSKAINELTKGKPGFKPLEEQVGHTPAEVLVGATVGVLVPVITYLLFYIF